MKKQPPEKQKPLIINDDDTSGGASGSTGSSVKMVDFISTPSGEARYELLLEKLRKGEAKLGAVILPAVKQSRVQRPSELSQSRSGYGIKSHPKLGGPRWNGQDTRLSQKVDQNTGAVEQFQNQLQLAQSLKQKFSASQRPSGA